MPGHLIIAHAASELRMSPGERWRVLDTVWIPQAGEWRLSLQQVSGTRSLCLWAQSVDGAEIELTRSGPGTASAVAIVD